MASTAKNNARRQARGSWFAGAESISPPQQRIGRQSVWRSHFLHTEHGRVPLDEDGYTWHRSASKKPAQFQNKVLRHYFRCDARDKNGCLFCPAKKTVDQTLGGALAITVRRSAEPHVCVPVGTPLRENDPEDEEKINPLEDPWEKAQQALNMFIHGDGAGGTTKMEAASRFKQESSESTGMLGQAAQPGDQPRPASTDSTVAGVWNLRTRKRGSRLGTRSPRGSRGSLAIDSEGPKKEKRDAPFLTSTAQLASEAAGGGHGAPHTLDAFGAETWTALGGWAEEATTSKHWLQQLPDMAEGPQADVAESSNADSKDEAYCIADDWDQWIGSCELEEVIRELDPGNGMPDATNQTVPTDESDDTALTETDDPKRSESPPCLDSSVTMSHGDTQRMPRQQPKAAARPHPCEDRVRDLDGYLQQLIDQYNSEL